MRYTVPDYYKSFKCIAGDCPATCCAGWQIVIDDAALKKYMKLAGIRRIKKGQPVMNKKGGTPFGSRLANSIDWENQTFLQYAGRCAFLDERNLCDIYTEAGPQFFCKTCRNYPRHIEEFENEREVSLSLSCPVVARMLLDRMESVKFVNRETPEEEQEEEFDEFLYFMLQDCRSVMFEILQNREKPIVFRMAKVLALAHDVQNRIDARAMFEIETVLERYQREGADEVLSRKLGRYLGNEEHQSAANQETGGGRKRALERQADTGNQNVRMMLRKNLMELLDELEILDSSWPEQLRIYKKVLYGKGAAAYEKLAADLEKQMPWKEIEAEQLMVYFLFTYFCGAVYDGDALAKVKLAAVSTLLIQEMELAAMAAGTDGEEVAGTGAEPGSEEDGGENDQECAAGNRYGVSLEDRARIAWRFSRELEHSDQNLDTMEELMNESGAADFEALLRCILATVV